ncbi:MAG: efflux RND transporter permease subunit [Pseudomonadota bacterium]
MNLTDFSVDRPVSITMLVGIVMVVGAIALARLGIDMMPEIDFPTLSVMVRYPGAPSEEVESIVAKTYEGALAGVSGVQKVKSVSQEDVCYLMLDFEWGTDLDAAAADIREAVAMIAPYMPPDVEDPLVLKFNLSAMPQAIFTVTGMDEPVALRELIEDVVQPRLERLEGVAQAALFFGGAEEEIQVNLDRAALLDSGVGLDQVAMALGYQNLNLPAGRQVQGRKEVLLRTLGQFNDLEEMRRVAVGASPSSGTPILLGTVAEVKRTLRDARNLVRANGEQAAMLMIAKEAGANPFKVMKLYQGKLDELAPLLPASVQFQNLFDIGRIIEKMAGAVVSNGVIGALLAVFIMYLFLRNIRPTLTIAVAIPLSLLATFIPIYATGDTLNMMTMGGLVLGIGMLVDNAVVVIENIFRHIEEGKDRRTAAKLGSREVGMAITASTFTTMVVFLPILFSNGMAGQLASGLAITVAAALLSSLFVALTIVPMLSSVFFSSKVQGSVLHDGRLFARFRGWYARRLTWCLAHRGFTLGGVGGLVLLSAVMAYFVGAEFMPSSNDPVLMAKLSFPVGTSLEETAAASKRVEEVIGQFPDVQTVGASIGVDENDAGAGMSDTNPAGVHEAMIFARLEDREDRQIKENDTLKAMIRERMPNIEGMEFNFMDMNAGMGGSAHAIDIKLSGDEFEELRVWSERIAAAIVGIEGLQGVDTSMREAKPEAHIIIDREKAAGYGLTVGQVASTIKTATLGTVATRFRGKGEELDVRVRYAESFRSDPDDLRQILISLPRGGTIPLAQIATVEDGLGPVQIVRADQARTVSIYADIEGTDLRSAMGAVSAALAPIEQQLPQGYTIDFGGQYEDMMSAFGQLLAALVLAILMVYMVMAAQFESFSHPFSIMFTMPLAFIGVVWAFFLTGTTLSVPTFLGVIMLAGIVVNNGIVLVDYINQLRAQGVEIVQACIQGAATRLRPVLITSLTTIGAMVPMAISTKEGGETMAPLALTIIGGLGAATVFTLIVVPVVYTLVDSMARRGARLAMALLHGEREVGV